MASVRSLRTSSSLMCIGVVGVLCAYGYASYLKKNRFAGTENYTVVFPASLKGWRPLPKTPESLFIFENPTNGFLLRGSENQVIADINPTPEMNTDSMAQYYIDRTRENMPTWTAERISDIQGKNIRFSTIERKEKAHTVITAFTVKGNTTFMVSMSIRSEKATALNDAVKALSSYAAGISFKPTDMGGGKKAVIDDDGHQVAMQ